MNNLNVFSTYIEIELTETGLKILKEKDKKEKKVWGTVTKDSELFFENRIYDTNKLKTTIQEIMYLFGDEKHCVFCNGFPFKNDIKILEKG